MRTNRKGRKGITPVVAVILLLLMTIAAAGAAYLWIVKLGDMLRSEGTNRLTDDLKRQNTRYTIDSIWNESSDIFIVVRNTGSYELPATDFDKTIVYFDSKPSSVGPTTLATADCTYLGSELDALGGNFGIDTVMMLTCNSTYGSPVGGSYPRLSVKVQPPYGSLDMTTYQYSPN
ncbi:MAG: archaellin/type IV pilin N-terminal domain-containing protein [archaeon]